jgi:hypothetical protein
MNSKWNASKQRTTDLTHFKVIIKKDELIISITNKYYYFMNKIFIISKKRVKAGIREHIIR